MSPSSRACRRRRTPRYSDPIQPRTGVSTTENRCIPGALARSGEHRGRGVALAPGQTSGEEKLMRRLVCAGFVLAGVMLAATAFGGSSGETASAARAPGLPPWQLHLLSGSAAEAVGRDRARSLAPRAA